MSLWAQIGPKYISVDTNSSPDSVRLIQKALTNSGYPTATNGVFTGGMDKTVRQFQRDRGLTPDGKVGALTSQELDAVAARNLGVVQPKLKTGQYPIQDANSHWSGIIGVALTAREIWLYVASLDPALWKGNFRPQFCVLHNTGAPTLAQWRGKVTPDQRIKNLQNYYANEQHWHAGPHMFIADKIHLFTPLWMQGTHSPAWNKISLGFEMVGDFDTEAFDPIVRDNTVAALAAVHSHLGLNPAGLRLHKEDPATTHKNCPGKHVSKSDMIARITGAMANA